MNLRKFEQFQDLANSEGVIFYYEGEFTQNVVAAMADALKNRLENDPDAQKKKRKIFSTFVEMAQNVTHYSLPPLEDVTSECGHGCGAVAIGKHENRYFIASGNSVALEHVPRMREKLEPLRRMTLDEIKAAYKVQLRNTEHASDEVSRGAGLGFLTVAKDASEPIDYSIVETTENGGKAAYFFLRATI